MRRGEDQERRLLSDLRQRRHPHKHNAPTFRGEEHVQKHIERIETELEAQRKRSEVRILSKSRTMKSVAHKPPVAEKPRYPPQRER